MVSVGATLGRLTVLDKLRDMVLVRSVTVVRPIHHAVDNRYLSLYLKSPSSQKEIWAEVKQSAQPCLYLAKTSGLHFSLPPLAEQSRIVARVEALRTLCSGLRVRLAASQKTQTHLAETLVADCV
jgi:type I restriction enzyme S subunit